MREKIDYFILIESIQENVVDDFCLMFMKSDNDEVEDPYEIFYGFPDEYSLGEDLSSPTTDFSSYLVQHSNCEFFPATMSEYKKFITDRSIYKCLHCYHFQIIDGKYKITFTTDGLSFVYTLQKWVEIVRIIAQLNSIVRHNDVINDKKCPCFYCIVQATCVSSYRAGTFYKGKAKRPCHEYNEWKKYKFRELWNDLPFDIKQYEYEYYKEFLTYKDVLMLI